MHGTFEAINGASRRQVIRNPPGCVTRCVDGLQTQREQNPFLFIYCSSPHAINTVFISSRRRCMDLTVSKRLFVFSSHLCDRAGGVHFLFREVAKHGRE